MITSALNERKKREKMRPFLSKVDIYLLITYIYGYLNFYKTTKNHRKSGRYLFHQVIFDYCGEKSSSNTSIYTIIEIESMNEYAMWAMRSQTMCESEWYLCAYQRIQINKNT